MPRYTLQLVDASADSEWTKVTFEADDDDEAYQMADSTISMALGEIDAEGWCLMRDGVIIAEE